GHLTFTHRQNSAPVSSARLFNPEVEVNLLCSGCGNVSRLNGGATGKVRHLVLYSPVHWKRGMCTQGYAHSTVQKETASPSLHVLRALYWFHYPIHLLSFTSSQLKFICIDSTVQILLLEIKSTTLSVCVQCHKPSNKDQPCIFVAPLPKILNFLCACLISHKINNLE
ncbi:hypothetical protein NPIL_295061, partial [Nephila pilipes]